MRIRMLGLVLLSVGVACLFPGTAHTIPAFFNYQGRLADPDGNPRANVSVTVTFTLRDAEFGGTVLGGFTDTDTTITNDQGFFSSLVGDVETGQGIPDSIWAADNVFLGVSVNGEQLSPNVRLAATPYAFRSAKADHAAKADGAAHADDADQAGHAVSADTATNAANAIHATSAADADLLDGQDSTSFAPVTHLHSGENITTGTVADARIAASIARDDEVVQIVRDNDGPGSGLDADTIDGMDSSQLAVQDGSVTTQKIADLAVTTSKLANGSVTQAKRGAVPYSSTQFSQFTGANTNTWTPVPGASTTISVTGGRPVLLTLNQGWVNTGTGTGNQSRMQFRYLRDGSEVVQFSFAGRTASDDAGGIDLPGGAFTAFDLNPPAGSHTYAIEVRRHSSSTGGAGANIDVSGQILAIEL
ncbi:MAG: hypothetical protein HUU16_02445 [Candidatus Omnitrophica bacterium]|nr:hypothetical protein [Candidatus Omnitrophota bacterium]